LSGAKQTKNLISSLGRLFRDVSLPHRIREDRSFLCLVNFTFEVVATFGVGIELPPGGRPQFDGQFALCAPTQPYDYSLRQKLERIGIKEVDTSDSFFSGPKGHDGVLRFRRREQDFDLNIALVLRGETRTKKEQHPCEEMEGDCISSWPTRYMTHPDYDIRSKSRGHWQFLQEPRIPEVHPARGPDCHEFSVRMPSLCALRGSAF
jgi:hypothetical protein